MTDPSRREFLVQTAGALAAYALLPEPVAAVAVPAGRAIRIGLIGAGRQGRAILAELQKIEGVEIAAVCDVVPARIRSAIERAPGAASHADHRALLESTPAIEAVIIATPTHLHRAIALDAIAAGRHVYCEAPLASTIDDCRTIESAANAAVTVFHSGFHARSNPLYRRTWSLLRAGSLRDIVAVHARHHRKTSWRFPASDALLERAANWRLDPEVSIGLAGELGTHQIDAIQWLLNASPERVDGIGSIRLWDDGRFVPDTISARVHFPGGIVLDYGATLANSYGDVHEVIFGSHAAVRLAWSHGWLFKEADAPTEGWEVYATRQQFHNDEGIALVADATQLASQGRLREGIGLPHPPLYYALADFIRSCTEGAPVACSASDGARATIVGILANRSIVTGSSVEIPAL
ncbi:MAG: Gfo/Idh/MocA family oxidoreductase [Gemmatimonadetes bacterium]|nr:Gfo/Idh/MocA family oxidoreductase [Gemmatimonadota bacterium]